MSRGLVKTVNSASEVLSDLAQLMKAVNDETREKAFCVFQRRGCEPGHELDDWLTAESELLYAPPCEVTENEREIRIKAAVEGFEAKGLHVDVLPGSITITGRKETKDLQKRLLRQFELPAAIDPNQVTATLEDGVLRVVAKKEVLATRPIIEEVKLARSATA